MDPPDAKRPATQSVVAIGKPWKRVLKDWALPLCVMWPGSRPPLIPLRCLRLRTILVGERLFQAKDETEPTEPSRGTEQHGRHERPRPNKARKTPPRSNLKCLSDKHDLVEAWPTSLGWERLKTSMGGAKLSPGSPLNPAPHGASPLPRPRRPASRLLSASDVPFTGKTHEQSSGVLLRCSMASLNWSVASWTVLGGH